MFALETGFDYESEAEAVGKSFFPSNAIMAFARSFFFFSSLAVNALWHGPERDISGVKRGT